MSRYNGWANYETWATYTWITNDESSDRDARRLVKLSANAYEGGQLVKDMIWESCPDLPATLYSDLLRASLNEINWSEISQTLRDDDEELNSDA